MFLWILRQDLSSGGFLFSSIRTSYLLHVLHHLRIPRQACAQLHTHVFLASTSQCESKYPRLIRLHLLMWSSLHWQSGDSYSAWWGVSLVTSCLCSTTLLDFLTCFFQCRSWVHFLAEHTLFWWYRHQRVFPRNQAYLDLHLCKIQQRFSCPYISNQWRLMQSLVPIEMREENPGHDAFQFSFCSNWRGQSLWLMLAILFLESRWRE